MVSQSCWQATLEGWTNMRVYAQDAEAYNQRNINEEGGGGYIAYVWDCAYWGTQVKLAQFTGSATYASEVPYSTHLSNERPSNSLIPRVLGASHAERSPLHVNLSFDLQAAYFIQHKCGTV